MRTKKQKLANKKWYEKLKSDSIRYSKHLEKNAKAQAKYRELNEDKVKQRQVAKYGLTLFQYKEMLKDQDSKCKICKSEEKLHIDHCHNTGDVRGLLCHKCNRGIGLLQDSAEILENAYKYLKGFK